MVMPFDLLVRELGQRHHERAAPTHIRSRLLGKCREECVDTFGSGATVLRRGRLEPLAITLLGALDVSCNERVLGRKEAIERGWCNARLRRDAIDASSADAVPVKELARHVEDVLSGLL